VRQVEIHEAENCEFIAIGEVLRTLMAGFVVIGVAFGAGGAHWRKVELTAPCGCWTLDHS
jgi:hypothetical protein